MRLFIFPEFLENAVCQITLYVCVVWCSEIQMLIFTYVILISQTETCFRLLKLIFATRCKSELFSIYLWVDLRADELFDVQNISIVYVKYMESSFSVLYIMGTLLCQLKKLISKKC